MQQLRRLDSYTSGLWNLTSCIIYVMLTLEGNSLCKWSVLRMTYYEMYLTAQFCMHMNTVAPVYIELSWSETLSVDTIAGTCMKDVKQVRFHRSEKLNEMSLQYQTQLFVPYWQDFRNSMMVDIKLWRSEPFMQNSTGQLHRSR